MARCQHLCKWVYDALAAQMQHVLNKSRSSHEAAIHRPQSTNIIRCIITRNNFIEYILNTRLVSAGNDLIFG